MYEVLVGIPSLNEARSIREVVVRIDAGLAEYYPALRALIVNVDNNSTDGTREAFTSVSTRSDKLYVPTEPGETGKGANVRNFLRMAADLGVRAGAIFDADLESLSPRWVRNVLGPILEEGYDFTFPLYRRHRHDGSITNHLCYPLVHGLFGTSIRQPIAGEFGFSRTLIDHLAACDLPEPTRAFGIDIFITTESIACRASACGVALGAKVHKGRDPVTSVRMCLEVVATLLHQVRRHREALLPRRLLLRPSALLDTVTQDAVPPVPLDVAGMLALFVDGFRLSASLYEAALPAALTARLGAMAAHGRPEIEGDTWCQLVYALIRHHVHGPGDAAGVAAAMMPLFYGRFLTFLEEIHALDDHEVEQRLAAQAQTFHDRRAEALETPT